MCIYMLIEESKIAEEEEKKSNMYNNSRRQRAPIFFPFYFGLEEIPSRKE